MKAEIKLLPARGKIKINCYVTVDRNVIKVNNVDGDTVEGYNIVTNERARYYTNETRFLKLFLVEQSKVLGELAYRHYDQCHPGDIIDTDKFSYTRVPNNVIVGDKVVVCSMPLSELHKFRFNYANGEYSLPGGETLLTGTIIVARNKEYIIKTCDNKTLVLKRNSFVIANGRNTKRIYYKK